MKERVHDKMSEKKMRKIRKKIIIRKQFAEMPEKWQKRLKNCKQHNVNQIVVASLYHVVWKWSAECRFGSLSSLQFRSVFHTIKTITKWFVRTQSFSTKRKAITKIWYLNISPVHLNSRRSLLVAYSVRFDIRRNLFSITTINESNACFLFDQSISLLLSLARSLSRWLSHCFT